ncbi:MAG: CBS domain-containing protein [Candidatus Promineifilaceae bacterium]|nr:CBS domain-containing protein [Candidatus Promineifilaceae bacterium]
MKVSRILATKPAKLITIGSAEDVRAAINKLAENRIGALLVVNETGKLIGIISERDIVRRAAQDPDFSLQPVGDVMTRRVKVGLPQDDIMSVAHTMTEGRFRHLPIVDDNYNLVGMISIGDVMKAQRDAYRGEIDTLELQVMADQD